MPARIVSRPAALSARVGVAALAQALAFQRRPVSTLLREAQAGGDAFTLVTPMAGRACVLATPELAHEVLHSPPGRYRAGAANRRILPVLPQGTLLTMDGAEHRARRGALAPLFHGDSLQAMAPIIREIAATELERWPVGRPFAVLPRTRFMTLCIAARLVLGIEGQQLVGELERHLSDALRPYSMLAGVHRLERLGPASPQAFAIRCRAGFAHGVAKVRGARESGQHEGPTDAVDLLCAAAGPDGRLDDPEVADELFALLLAGHETTATALAWAVELLARDPATAAALADETRAEDRPLLDSTVLEALRLRPPLVDIVRELTEPARLGGHELPAATLILIPPTLIHRHTQPAGESFLADRFLGRRPDPRTWLPFGGGERRCLGASLALLELREILAQLIKRFELHPAGKHPEAAGLHGTALIPASGTRVLLRPR